MKVDGKDGKWEENLQGNLSLSNIFFVFYTISSVNRQIGTEYNLRYKVPLQAWSTFTLIHTIYPPALQY
jgi:hypothetical protein